MDEQIKKDSGSPRAVLRLYGKVLRKYPYSLAFMLIGVIGMQITNLIIPLYLRQLINIIARNTPSPEVVAQAISILAMIAMWWFLRWFFNRLEHFVNLRVIVHGMADLGEQAFQYLINHSHNFFTSTFSGSLTHKITKLSKAFQGLYEALVMSFLPTFVFTVGAIIVLYLHYPLLGVALAVWVVLFFIFQIWATNLRQPLRRAHAAADTRITATLADAISNQNTISLFSGEKYESSLVNEVERSWRKLGIRSWSADAWLWSGIGLFMIGIEATLMYGAIILWGQGLLVVGDFVLIQAYILTLFERMVSVQQDMRKIYNGFADGGEMVAILETPHGVQDTPTAKPLVVSKGEISFKEVDFFFHQTRPILENFVLTVHPSEKIALVGPSGAGKSTITKLLLRLYDITDGSIEIDGQNIAQVTQESLRNAIGFVPQEPILFHRTLMDNIRYGKRDATDEEVIEAARQAHCHEFIDALPQKYETFVGERGVKLSGGERQRVAIARAILKNAPILILDEATSSLDSESESLIQDALQSLMQGKTVIVIAHRLSTIMKMDRIVVLEGGTVVAEGTHDELLQQGGLYQKLWSIQAGGFIVDTEENEEPLAEMPEKS